MSPRKIDPAKYGFTEEQWRALDEDTRAQYCLRDYYQRNKEAKQTYQREYARAYKARTGNWPR